MFGGGGSTDLSQFNAKIIASKLDWQNISSHNQFLSIRLITFVRKSLLKYFGKFRSKFSAISETCKDTSLSITSPDMHMKATLPEILLCNIVKG